MRMIRVAMIGCGDIAGGYDEKKKGAGIFSHAGAYSSVPNIEIAAAFDVNKKRLKNFCNYWPIKKLCATADDLIDGDYDIISICTPDNTHEALLESVIEKGHVKYIWIEKPMTVTASGAEKIICMAKKKNIGLWLSNQRRWDPGHIEAMEKIRCGVIGDVVHAAAYYVKGITHIGCTAVNTLRFLLGDVLWAMSFPPFNMGSYGKDRSLRGVLGFEKGCTATIIGCDKEEYQYSIFEIDIIGTNGRIRIENNGDIIRIYSAKEYSHYSGFRELVLSEKINTDMKWSMKYGLRLLCDDLLKPKRSVNSAEEGFKDIEVVGALKRSAERKGVKIEV